MTHVPQRVVDLFAGPGGFDEGARRVGLRPIGIELDRWACKTRAAAGHVTIRADARTVAPIACEGLIASPPCPDWSTAGSLARRDGETGGLVDLVTEWVHAVRPRWVVCEQVPGALVAWREHAHGYQSLGYSVWCGVLDMARYGVPQNRLRAVLVAHLDRPALPPEPTHGDGGWFGDLLPLVTMAEAVGWRGPLDRRQTGAPPVPVTRPAPTLTAMAGAKGVWKVDGRTITVAEGAALQTFPPDYPWRGPTFEQHRQIGNAVPPLFAARLLAAVASPVEAAA